MLTFLVQLQRLIVATEVGCSKPYHVDVKRALIKMRKTQMVFTILFVGSSSMAVAGSINVSVMTWWYLFVLLTLEATATTFSFISFTLNRLRHSKRPNGRPPARDGQQAEEGADGENTTSNNNSTYSKNHTVITPSISDQ
jgi:hypothetical protein